MTRLEAARAQLARNPDPTLAAEGCRALLMACIFNQAEQVAWEDINTATDIALAAFGISADDLDHLPEPGEHDVP